GELLIRAQDTRRLAEEAAAAAEGVLRWTAPLVEDGDTHRRKAQDLLFIDSAEPLKKAAEELQAAEDRYREALRGADLAHQALDFDASLAAELPYYGEWAVRRAVREDDAIEDALDSLLNPAVELAQFLHGTADSMDSARREGDSLERCRRQLADLEQRYREAKDAFEGIRKTFDAEIARQVDSNAEGRWRVLDDLLCVPTIDHLSRMALLQQVHSPTFTGSLASTPDRTIPRDPTTPPWSENARGESEADQDAAAEEGTTAGRSPGDQPNSTYWDLALGLARLELGLLALGGAEARGLAEATEAFEVARKATGSARFDAFDRLSNRLRLRRVAQLERIERSQRVANSEDDDVIAGDLDSATRAARVLPAADVRILADPAARLDRFRRYALLRWHGRRLLQDFAPRHAQLLFESARKAWGDTAALRADGDDLLKMKDARLAFAPVSAEGLTLADWVNQPLDLVLNSAPVIPAGDAVVSIGLGPDVPLSLSEHPSNRDARQGTLVAVSPDAASPVHYQVARTRPEAGQLRLIPSAFYRGRIYRSEAIRVALESVVEPISIALRQDYDPLSFKDFPDQMLEHPNDCYLHPGSPMHYKVAVTNNTNQRQQVDVLVNVAWRKPGEAEVKTLTLEPKKEAAIKGLVTSGEIPVGEPKKMTVTAKDKAGKLKLFPREFLFHQIPAEQYILVSAGVTGRNVFYISITHLKSDPVTGYSQVIPWIQTTAQMIPLGVPVPNSPNNP
ncbi:MAG TPA: hypothetical protein VF590_26035, partial [Isosphaeraceae bacterium]